MTGNVYDASMTLGEIGTALNERLQLLNAATAMLNEHEIQLPRALRAFDDAKTREALGEISRDALNECQRTVDELVESIARGRATVEREQRAVNAYTERQARGRQTKDDTKAIAARDDVLAANSLLRLKLIEALSAFDGREIAVNGLRQFLIHDRDEARAATRRRGFDSRPENPLTQPYFFQWHGQRFPIREVITALAERL